ncbi:MAG: aldo/keto reductase [Pseudonocardiaceae bacterium]
MSAQNHYNLLQRDAEQEVIPSCVNRGVGVLPYFPLANGLLTGQVQSRSGATSWDALDRA